MIPDAHVLCEGFAYEGIQRIVAVYTTAAAARDAMGEAAAKAEDAHTWYTVIVAPFG